MSRRLGWFVMAALLAAVAAPPALAADSDLDQTFGSGGTSRLYIGPLGAADGACVRLLPDGRMLVAGTMPDGTGGDMPFAARLLANGLLDTSYAAGGPTPGYVQLPGASASVTCTALGDGSFVVAENRSAGGAAFARLRSDGSVDGSFGANAARAGVMIFRLRTDGAGRVLAVGNSGSGNSGTPLITRLAADGSPDQTFGANGDVLLRSATSAPNTSGRVIDLIAIPGGGYEAAGTVWDGTSTGSLLLARLHADGSPDGSLGPSSTPGMVVDKLGFGANDGQTGWGSLLLDAQGRTIVAGEARWKVAIARIGQNGAPDTTFGDGASPSGTEVFSATVNGYETGFGSAAAVFPRPGGGYTLVGTCSSAGFAFAAVTADGRPDAAFAPGSTVTGERCVAAGDPRGGSAVATDAAADQAGRLVTVGSSPDGPQNGYAYDRLTLMRTIVPADGASGAGATPGDRSSTSTSTPGPVAPGTHTSERPGAAGSAATALLAHSETAAGVGGRIGALLKRGYSLTVSAPTAGVLTVRWYGGPAGTHVARHGNVERKSVLIAQGTVRFPAACRRRLHIALTSRGKQLLRRSRNLRVEARGTFAALGAAPVRRTASFVVRR